MQRKYPLFFLILAVLTSGICWRTPITDYVQIWFRLKPKQLWYCPDPKLVAANKSNPGSFTVDGMDWVIDFHGWQAPKKIGFMQALITADTNMTCYYKWIDPKDPSTNLWMTVKLSPAVNQKIRTYGTYWQGSKASNICSAGINACAIEIKQAY